MAQRIDDVSRRLVAQGIKKSFGAQVALAGVSLYVAPGEVHAIVGENGAGKSTLMNVLAGSVMADAGQIFLDGERYAPSGAHAARDAGIAMVHQELSLCRHMTVEENILLGVEPTKRGLVDRRELRRRAALAIEKLGSGHPELRPDARVGDLSPAAQQLVEIARAIGSSRCRLLILDEPTSSLGQKDVEQLFRVIRSLADQNIAVLYISHVLEEVRKVSDRFTVLRDGATVGQGRTQDVDLSEIVLLMAGRSVGELYPRSARTPGDAILTLDGVSGERVPVGASLELRRGEVLGIAGLIGAGRTELLRTIFGLDPVRRGTIRVGVHVGPASPARRLAQGVGMLSEDRQGEGLATSLSICDNITLSCMTGLGPLGLVIPDRQRRVAERFVSDLAIRASAPDQRVSDLSGGNQQKVALARLLYHDVDVLLLDEPTRGIDVASKAQIYGIIDTLAVRGRSVLIVSSYLPELFGICDRIAVMTRGRLGPARPVAELTAHQVLTEATGT
jgi:ribose transport system ATP-binding protein